MTSAGSSKRSRGLYAVLRPHFAQEGEGFFVPVDDPDTSRRLSSAPLAVAERCSRERRPDAGEQQRQHVGDLE